MKIKEITLGGKKEGQAMQSKWYWRLLHELWLDGDVPLHPRGQQIINKNTNE